MPLSPFHKRPVLRASIVYRAPRGSVAQALQDLLAEIADHCPFRLSNGDRDAGDDPRGCRRPSLSGIGAGGTAFVQAHRD
jgi:hypothetical protein